MTTIKAKLRRSTVEGKAGAIYYQINRSRCSRQITTDMRILPEEWDARRGRIAADKKMPGYRYQQRIDRDMATLRRIVGEAGAEPLPQIVARFRTCESRTDVMGYFEEQIIRLQEAGRLGTARNYRRTFNSFGDFLHGAALPFREFDERIVRAYNLYLERRAVMRNTISFYMRILRSVYNRAVRERLAEQTTPFAEVYTGVDRTRKRAVDEEVVIRMQRLDLTATPALLLARDLFLFSYGMRGMAFVDIAYLRKCDIAGDRIEYTRRKTGQRLAVHIEPFVRRIIDRYAERTRATPYVFPMLSAAEETEAYHQYETALGYYNRQLKRIGEMIGAGRQLSSYTSRHTWATTARNRDIPLSIISEGMGHSSERTTRIYLASIESARIDRANRRILAGLDGAAEP